MRAPTIAQACCLHSEQARTQKAHPGRNGARATHWPSNEASRRFISWRGVNTAWRSSSGGRASCVRTRWHGTRRCARVRCTRISDNRRRLDAEQHSSRLQRQGSDTGTGGPRARGPSTGHSSVPCACTCCIRLGRAVLLLRRAQGDSGGTCGWRGQPVRAKRREGGHARAANAVQGRHGITPWLGGRRTRAGRGRRLGARSLAFAPCLPVCCPTLSASSTGAATVVTLCGAV